VSFKAWSGIGLFYTQPFNQRSERRNDIPQGILLGQRYPQIVLACFLIPADEFLNLYRRHFAAILTTISSVLSDLRRFSFSS
jgi:hypothetical protein